MPQDQPWENPLFPKTHVDTPRATWVATLPRADSQPAFSSPHTRQQMATISRKVIPIDLFSLIPDLPNATHSVFPVVDCALRRRSAEDFEKNPKQFITIKAFVLAPKSNQLRRLFISAYLQHQKMLTFHCV